MSEVEKPPPGADQVLVDQWAEIPKRSPTENKVTREEVCRAVP